MRTTDRPEVRQRPRWRSVALVSGGLLAALFIAGAARADDKRSAPAPLLARYAQECAACHLPYPPGMLPAASWQRLMGKLPRHFGTDASLDAVTAGELSTWLMTNAGTYKRVSEAPPEDRITRSAWFLRKHRDVAPDVWKRPAVGSPGNCDACHPAAAQGRFSEHDIRIPK